MTGCVRLLPGFMKRVVLDVVQQDMEWVCIKENSQMAMLVLRNDSNRKTTADFASRISHHSSTKLAAA